MYIAYVFFALKKTKNNPLSFYPIINVAHVKGELSRLTSASLDPDTN